MKKIIIKVAKMPNTTNAWGFDGHYDRVSFSIEGLTEHPDNGWVFGKWGYRHQKSMPQLINKNMRVVINKMSIKKAKEYIQKFYELHLKNENLEFEFINVSPITEIYKNDDDNFPAEYEKFIKSIEN